VSLWFILWGGAGCYNNRMIEIDGAEGEGGGQMVRTSLALSLITGKAFHLYRLRAGRAKPGLHAQHLASVRAAATIGQARLEGAALRSSDLVFEPGTVQPGNYHFDIGTAGTTALVLHTVYLPLALALGPSTVTIEGGTHVRTAPSFHFLAITWQAYLRRIGLDIDVTMRRPGFYPRGGGAIEANIKPWRQREGLNIATLTRPLRARCLSAVAGLPEHILHRQADRARAGLHQLGLDTDVYEESWPGGPGTMLGIELPTAPAPTFLFTVGERGKRAERVADEAVAQVAAFLKAEPPGIDEHSADQLVLPLALSPQPSSFPVAAVSSHLLTNVAVIQRFLERKIIVEGNLGQPGLVRIPLAA
jgi:RNA 3'-terminal phosphate cyclase (ATP)